jgi:hypothetical protein
LVRKEALGLSLGISIRLDRCVGWSRTAAEECSVYTDGKLSHGNTNDAGGSTNDKTNHDWDEDTQDSSSDESAETGVLVVMVGMETVVRVVGLAKRVGMVGWVLHAMVWTHASAVLEL